MLLENSNKGKNKLYEINQEELKEEIVNIVKEHPNRIEIENVKKKFKAEKEKILKFFTEMTIKSIIGTDETNIISTLVPPEQYLDTKRSRKGQNPVYFYENFQSPNQEKVALKLVELPLQNKIKEENCLREEYSNMIRCCWNPEAHVICPLAFCHNSAYVGILMQHGGIPLDVWWKDSEWSVKNTVSIFQQLASGLNIIHSQKIFHGDIKPNNILIKEGVARFTDFGTSLLYDCTQSFLQTKPNYRELKGYTILYTPPEITIPLRTNTAPQQGIKLDKIDIFALAFTIYSVLIRSRPMVEEVEIGGRLMKEGEGKWKDNEQTYSKFLECVEKKLNLVLSRESPVYRKNLVSLICRCLQFDPHHRISCVDILNALANL